MKKEYRLYQCTSNLVLNDVHRKMKKIIDAKLATYQYGWQAVIIIHQSARHWIKDVFYDKHLIKMLRRFIHCRGVTNKMLIQIFDSCNYQGMSVDVADIICKYIGSGSTESMIQQHNSMLKKYLKKHSFTQNGLAYSIV